MWVEAKLRRTLVALAVVGLASTLGTTAQAAAPLQPTATSAVAKAPSAAQKSLAASWYRRLYGREATSSEVNATASAVANGTPPATAIRTLLNSTEGRSHEVRSYFARYLGVAASSAQQLAYSKQLQSGKTTESVIASLLASATAWAKAGQTTDRWIVYAGRAALNRVPTATETKSWRALVAKPNGRLLAAQAIVASQTARSFRVGSYYAAYFNRAISVSFRAALLTNWVNDDIDRIQILLSGGTGSSAAPAPSAKPGASNTGVPAGHALARSGAITATVAGQVIDGKDITGGVIVRAHGVVIKNSRIRGSGSGQCVDVVGGGSVVIQDSEITGGCENGIGFDNWTAIRVNLHGTYGDGVKFGTNVLLQDSWIHGLAPAQGAHADGGQLQGGVTNLVIRHNNITVADTSNGNAALFMAPDLGPSSNGPVLVDSNWLDGGNYTLFFVDGNDGQYHQRGATFTRNRFAATHSYGYSDVNEPIAQAGNVIDATGAPLSL